MATHSSVLAWRILWTEEPGEPQSTGLHRAGRDRSDVAHYQVLSNVLDGKDAVMGLCGL